MNPPSQEAVRQWVDQWQVVGEEMERLRALELQAMTEEEAARIFNGLDCDPSLVWTSEERRTSSGLVEQQRIFSRGHGSASHLHRSF